MQGAVGQQATAAAVVELNERGGQVAQAGDFTGAVVNGAGVQQQATCGVDDAQLVEHLAGDARSQHSATGQFALLAVIQRLGRDVQIAAAADQPALRVQYLRGVDVCVAALAQNTAGLTVVDHTRSNPCAGLTVQGCALVVQRLGNGSLQGTAGSDAAAVGQAVGRQGHIARRVAAVVRVDARFDHGRVAQLATSGKGQRIACSDVLPGCEITASGHRQ